MTVPIRTKVLSSAPSLSTHRVKKYGAMQIQSKAETTIDSICTAGCATNNSRGTPTKKRRATDQDTKARAANNPRRRKEIQFDEQELETETSRTTPNPDSTQEPLLELLVSYLNRVAVGRITGLNQLSIDIQYLNCCVRDETIQACAQIDRARDFLGTGESSIESPPSGRHTPIPGPLHSGGFLAPNSSNTPPRIYMFMARNDCSGFPAESRIVTVTSQTPSRP
jgi:hypothetical protein